MSLAKNMLVTAKKIPVEQRERVKNENKNITHIDPKQSTPLQKNADNASTKENADNSEDNSSIKSRDINSKSKKLIVILGESMLKHLNGSKMSKKVKSDSKIFVKQDFARHCNLDSQSSVFSQRRKL